MINPIEHQIKGLPANPTSVEHRKAIKENDRLPASRPIKSSIELDGAVESNNQKTNSCPAAKVVAKNGNYSRSYGDDTSGVALNVSISGKDARVVITREDASPKDEKANGLGNVFALTVSGMNSGDIAVFVHDEMLIVDVNSERFYILKGGRIEDRSGKEVSAKEKAALWSALVDVSTVLGTMNSKDARYCAVAQGNGTVIASTIEKITGRYFDGRAVSDLNSRVLTIMSTIQVEALE